MTKIDIGRKLAPAFVAAEQSLRALLEAASTIAPAYAVFEIGAALSNLDVAKRKVNE